MHCCSERDGASLAAQLKAEKCSLATHQMVQDKAAQTNDCLPVNIYSHLTFERRVQHFLLLEGEAGIQSHNPLATSALRCRAAWGSPEVPPGGHSTGNSSGAGRRQGLPPEPPTQLLIRAGASAPNLSRWHPSDQHQQLSMPRLYTGIAQLMYCII